MPLSHDNEYFRHAPAHDFWALAAYYVPQMNDYACSAASVAMIVNAAVRAGRTLTNDDQNITQSVLLDRVRAEHWKELLSPEGYQSRHGVTLEQLRTITEASLHAFGAPDSTARAVIADDSSEGLMRFRLALVENERNHRDALLIHFLQDEVTLAPGGPYAHVCPVGAYDAEHRRVLVFDVDRLWYEPYWVSDTVLWHAMSRSTVSFGAGGYVRALFEANER